jgi:hypothetical protein
MKKLKEISIISMVLLMVALCPAKLFASVDESDVKSAMAYDGWKFSQTIYADLIEGQSCTWWFRTFYANREYKIVAFSEDDDVNEVSLQVQYPFGTRFLDDSDLKATVHFYCYSDRRLKIAITNKDSDDPNYASRCKFMIFYKEI